MMGTGSSGTLFPISPPPGEVKVWGLPQEDIDIINNLPEGVTAEFVQTPESSSILSFVALGILGIVPILKGKLK